MKSSLLFDRAAKQNRLFYIALSLSFCLFLSSCTTAQNNITDTISIFSAEQISNDYSFRHRVKLILPEQELSFNFTGLMQFVDEATQGEQVVRVAGISGIGLQLFSIRLNRDRHVLEYMHPSIARIAHLEDYIVFCVRSIWLNEDGTVVGKNWSIQRSGERPWPANLRFIHENPDFEVQIRLLEYIPQGEES